MNVKIKNCNNIDEGEFTITEGYLNIKLGINGTGKSTMAKALDYEINSPEMLKSLLPFKLVEDNPDEKIPEVEVSSLVNEALTFNEDYLRKFTFQQDELLKNSFDIFIRTESYDQKISEINAMVSGITNVFRENETLLKIISDLRELSSSFKFTKTGMSKTSNFYKSLGAGNKLENIPSGLEAYTPFLKDQNNVSWLDWQLKGNDFSSISDVCPYCTSPTAEKKETIQKVSSEYNKNTIRHLSAIISAIERLGGYFSEEAKETLSTITTKKEGLDKEEESFLVGVKNQIDDLILKLESMKVLSSKDFSNQEKVSAKLSSMRVNLALFDRLNSPRTEAIVSDLNASIDTVLEKVGLLQGEVNKQQLEVEKSIKKHQKEINEFLKYAGYKYTVSMEGELSDCKLRLQHIDLKDVVSSGDQHLSFGERNAFAIVLFMYECLAKNPDLIILDDPISSFDKNKKYALIEMLFLKKESLKGKTVLLLTHDVEPVIDTIKVLKRKFSSATKAHFLRARDNELCELEIDYSDILTFPQICQRVIAGESPPIVKLIYLRRYYEVIDDLGREYQMLSSLFKSRSTPTDHSQEGNPEMSEEEIHKAQVRIQQSIPHFSYSSMLSEIADQDKLKAAYSSANSGYEKLQLFKLIEGEHENDVIRKYINETYHIENELICQLDPNVFDITPDFVVLECDKFVADPLEC